MNKCKGIKKCPAEDCSTAYNNYAKYNSCVNHKKEFSHVVPAGEECPVTFFYVYPVDDADNRQWLGCLSKAGGHSPPSIIDWKLKSQTKHDLRKAKIANPFGKPVEFQKGLGFNYEPMLTDPAASHSGVFSIHISKASPGSCRSRMFSTMETVSQFHKIAEEIDTKTSPEQVDSQIKQELDEMLSNYAIEDHFVMIGDRMYGFLAENIKPKFLQSRLTFFSTYVISKKRNFQDYLSKIEVFRTFLKIVSLDLAENHLFYFFQISYKK